MLNGPTNLAKTAALTTEPGRQRQIASAFKAGLDDLDGCFVHGTTLEALKLLIETGSLPTGCGNGSLNYIYFEPLQSRFPYQPRRAIVAATDREALDNCKVYASALSFDFKVLRAIGATRYDGPIRSALMDLSGLHPRGFSAAHFNETKYEALRNAGLTFEVAKEILRTHSESEGVLMLFSRSLGDAFTIDEAEEGDEGLRVHAPNGIPLQFIRGIEPCSDHVFDFLEKFSA